MKKKIIAAVVIILICAGAVFFLRSLKAPESSGIILKNRYDREAYLGIRGFAAKELCSQKIRIPESFGGAYKEFSDIQSEQKLPLNAHAGEGAERYIYALEGCGDEYAELIICGDTLVGAGIIDMSEHKTKPLS